MLEYHTPRQQVRRIIANKSAEPFTELPRRPNGYLQTPKYRQWLADTNAWHSRIASWLRGGLALSAESDTVCVTLFGQPLEQTRLTKLPNGLIRWPGPAIPDQRPPLQPGERRPEYWAAPLELPGPRQDIAKFLEQNSKHGDYYVRWDLEERIQHHAADNDIEPPPEVWRAIRAHTKDLAIRWIAAARDLIDPQPLAQIRQAAGHPTGRNLFLHNLAATSGDLITGLSATNPGAIT